MNCHANNARRRFLRQAGEVIALLTCSAPLALGSAMAKPEDAAMTPHPLVPFATTLGAWDHHWFLWLPHHPIYESVEVASREPESDGRVAVWVWFTERAGAKRQIHYRNDPQLAAVISGNYCPIAFQIAGEEGRPRGLEVRFDDIENRPVEIDVAFDPDQALSGQGAGLTDQSGHMSDRAFLIFHRDRNALARLGRASIGNSNYTFGSDEAKGAFPFRWAYSQGISIALILYNSFTAKFGQGGYAPSPGTEGLSVMPRRGGGSFSLRSDQAGRLKEYVERDARDYFIRVVFDPPLPPGGGDNARQSSTFSISIRAAADLVKGHVESRCDDRACVLDWQPTEPLWASKRAFRSEISRLDDHSDQIAVRSAP
jgi:hypothetical protein